MSHATPGSMLFALIGTVAIAACAPKTGQHDAATDEAAIATTASGWDKAYNEKNADAVAALYTEDAQLLPPGAPIVNGRAAIRDFWANDIATNNMTFAIAADATGVGGDWGWRSGSWRAAGADGATAASGKFAEIWRRTKEGWRIHRDIWNEDAQPAAPEAPTQ